MGVSGLAEPARGNRARIALGSRLARLGNPEEIVLGLVPYAVLIGLIAWVGFLVPASLSLSQVTVVTNQSMVLILIAVGQTVVLLGGGIDLSVGGILSLVSAIAATHMGSGAAAVTVTALLLACGWIPGAVNGALIAYAGLQPFIVTLATWFIWGGIAFYVLPSAGGSVDPSLGAIATGNVLGLPNPIALLVAVIIAGWWLQRTKLGLEVRSVGSDADAACQSGVRVRRAVITAYAASSLCTVLAGIVLSAQSMSGDPTVGNTYILPSVAAAVIGGTALTGGQGTIAGSIVGAYVLAYVTSATYALGLPSQWALIFEGILLVLSVSLQVAVRWTLGARRE
jgi:ribose transport system permease protein